jgi:AraC family transcriptional regulator
MADGVGLSVAHFAQAFRRHTGSTPHNYLLRRRIDRAISLLRGAQAYVAVLAEKLGLATPLIFVTTLRTTRSVTLGVLRQTLAG